MINLRPVIFIIGALLSILSLAMVVPAFVDIVVGNPDWQTFAMSAFLTAFVGVSMVLTNQGQSGKLTTKQAFIVTTFTWIMLAAFAALPLYLSEMNISYTDAFFESMSGLTTTGATVISGLDQLPPGILLWRAILQWMGGIGIIVVAMAVLPMLQIGGMQLFRTESSDKSEKILPRTTQVSGAISGVYLLLTMTCALLLWLAGMGGFDAICHAMTTIATAGFSTRDGSIGYFNNPVIEGIIIVFMLISSLPYVLYIQALRGRHDAFLRDSQVKWLLSIVILMVAIMTWWLTEYQGIKFVQALRMAAFNITAVITTTGFTANDYSTWGSFAVTSFFLLSVIGGCTGSTTGGIKVFRYQVLYETAKSQINRLIHPHGVFRPRFNDKPITEHTTNSVMGFFVLFAFSFLVASVLLSFTGLDYLTSMSAAAAGLANLGPGLGDVIGPSGNYQSLTDMAKWLLTFIMLVGRLEIFTVLVLFSVHFWRD